MSLASAYLLLALAAPMYVSPGIIEARPTAVTTDAPRGFRALRHDGGREGWLYVPSGYDPRRPAPFLLLLHGAGGDPRRLLDRFKPHAEATGAILMAPGSAAATWDLIADHGFGRDAKAIDALLGQVFARYAVDRLRTGIAGFSDGGSYALSLGLANGDLFGHVLAFSPGFVSPARQAGRPYVFVSHGRADAVLPIDATSRRIAATLRSAGYPHRYAEFDGGHQLPPDLADVLADATAPAHSHPDKAAAGPVPLARPIADAGGDTLEARLGVAGRPIARWREPACLRVTGASATFTQQVEVQVRSIAIAAGVPYEWGRCRANLTLALHDRRAPPRHAYTRRASRSALASATVTLDKRRAEALRAPAVAAYVALAGFAELPPAKAQPPGTLLALFERADAPRKLTTLDLDFLRRLYAKAG
ncbi:alpha/beta hydrolase [Sphingoaurantiacus capsulatus]|uniref:Alpha/beta hydrolase n=1 Tax=Sphingoaurantiacus capsulatus TaxID=1771310 RepID=A0ABV7X7Q3_9SPHN